MASMMVVKLVANWADTLGRSSVAWRVESLDCSSVGERVVKMAANLVDYLVELTALKKVA